MSHEPEVTFHRPGVRRSGAVGAGRSRMFLRAFVIQAFRIPSESMRDTLLVGDFLFVNKFEYGPKIPFTHIRLPGLRARRSVAT